MTVVAAEDQRPDRVPRPAVTVHGSGMMFRVIAAALNVSSLAAHGPSGGIPVAVTATDATADDAYWAARAAMSRGAVVWLPVRAEDGWAVIGPAGIPGAAGCPVCAERRWAANNPRSRENAALREVHGPAVLDRPSRLVSPIVAGAVAALVTDEAIRLAGRADGVRTMCAVVRLALTMPASATHRLLPDPLCPACGDVPRSTADAARVALRPAIKLGGGWRTRDVSARQADLERQYLDPRTGVVSSLTALPNEAVPTAVAVTGMPGAADPAARTLFGYGRRLDSQSSQLTALLEALERRAGSVPLGRRAAVQASYDEVAEHALDPRTLGLYPAEWYAQLGFEFEPFDPARRMPWVWGYSFGQERPMLLPERSVFYRQGGKQRPLAFETSNGCALGNCLEEAIFHGLLEVAERDAFLMTWYTRMAVPAIDLDSAADRRLPVLAAKARRAFGYELKAFVTTVEQRVPTVWVMAVNLRSGQERPHMLCGAAAHPDVERALLGSLTEVVAGALAWPKISAPGTAALMLENPDLVRTMADHPLLYSHPDAFSRLDFIDTGAAPRPLSSFGKLWAWPAHDDLAADTAELLTRFLGTGLDVIVVDQTTPELRAGGLAAAKVLVPGTLPMTFGHRYRRINGIPRLYRVPRLLGRAERDLGTEDVNPHPHPFP